MIGMNAEWMDCRAAPSPNFTSSLASLADSLYVVNEDSSRDTFPWASSAQFMGESRPGSASLLSSADGQPQLSPSQRYLPGSPSTSAPPQPPPPVRFRPVASAQPLARFVHHRQVMEVVDAPLKCPGEEKEKRIRPPRLRMASRLPLSSVECSEEWPSAGPSLLSTDNEGEGRSRSSSDCTRHTAESPETATYHRRSFSEPAFISLQEAAAASEAGDSAVVAEASEPIKEEAERKARYHQDIHDSQPLHNGLDPVVGPPSGTRISYVGGVVLRSARRPLLFGGLRCLLVLRDEHIYFRKSLETSRNVSPPISLSHVQFINAASDGKFAIHAREDSPDFKKTEFIAADSATRQAIGDLLKHMWYSSPFGCACRSVPQDDVFASTSDGSFLLARVRIYESGEEQERTEEECNELGILHRKDGLAFRSSLATLRRWHEANVCVSAPHSLLVSFRHRHRHGCVDLRTVLRFLVRNAAGDDVADAEADCVVLEFDAARQLELRGDPRRTLPRLLRVLRVACLQPQTTLQGCRLDAHGVPVVVSRALRWLTCDVALSTMGIHRTPGRFSAKRELIHKMINSPADVFISDPIPETAENALVVADSLREFLRRMQSPLFPDVLHEPLFDAVKEIDEWTRAAKMRRAFESRCLPRVHSATALALARYARVAAEHEAASGASIQNLARIFAPSLFSDFHCGGDAAELLADATPRVVVVCYLFEHADKLFFHEERTMTILKF